MMILSGSLFLDTKKHISILPSISTCSYITVTIVELHKITNGHFRAPYQRYSEYPLPADIKHQSCNVTIISSKH